MTDYSMEYTEQDAVVGMMSLIGVARSQTRPVSWGNYFDLGGQDQKESIRVVNIWAENLEHLVAAGVLSNGKIRGWLYKTDKASWFLVDDARVPIEYLYTDMCFTGCSKPPNAAYQDMVDKMIAKFAAKNLVDEIDKEILEDLIVSGRVLQDEQSIHNKLTLTIESSNEEKMVTITEKEYHELLDRDQWLTALENAGVDNWSGYDYARELMNGDED